MSNKNQRCDPPPASDRVYFALQRFFALFIRVTMRSEVVGAENMPTSGGFLVTANHQSFFDSPLVFTNTPVRMRVFGADKWRRTPGIVQLMETVGVIWVARGEADRDAVKAALNLLKAGGRLGMAPEGTRSRTGELQPGKPGAAYLADRAQTPIVPMAITGTRHVLRSWARLRRPCVGVVIGKPYRLPGDGRAKNAQLEENTEIIMCKLAALLPPEFRGAYADHPRLLAMLGQEKSEVSV